MTGLSLNGAVSRVKRYKYSKRAFFRILHQDRVQKLFNVMITTFENRYVLKIYVIVLRSIFDTTYKGKNRSKYTCDVYITNLSYSNKIGIVFAMYQRMRSKVKYCDGPRQFLKVMRQVLVNSILLTKTCPGFSLVQY